MVYKQENHVAEEQLYFASVMDNLALDASYYKDVSI